jgi:hypothetical protein
MIVGRSRTAASGSDLRAARASLWNDIIGITNAAVALPPRKP